MARVHRTTYDGLLLTEGLTTIFCIWVPSLKGDSMKKFFGLFLVALLHTNFVLAESALTANYRGSTFFGYKVERELAPIYPTEVRSILHHGGRSFLVTDIGIYTKYESWMKTGYFMVIPFCYSTGVESYGCEAAQVTNLDEATGVVDLIMDGAVVKASLNEVHWMEFGESKSVNIKANSVPSFLLKNGKPF